jgi:hypothetical protein
VDLFEFNDDFIASVACGMSDEDVLELFADSIRAGADVLEERLIRSVGPELASQATFVDGAFEIPLTQEQYDAEFGGPGEAPQANVRRAIISATIPAVQEMTKVLGAD